MPAKVRKQNMTSSSSSSLREKLAGCGRTAGAAMVALLIMFGFFCRPVQGYFLSMISDSQFYVVDPGESVSMECNFHADRYSLFDYPVMWRKRQLAEDLPINILGNINDPFVETNRFEVNFVSHEPRYQLELSITDVVLEDTGNYTCEIRNSHSAILAQVTHFLFVRAPVDEVYLTTEFTSATAHVLSSHDGGHAVPSSFMPPHRVPASTTSSNTFPLPVPPSPLHADGTVVHLVENHPSTVSCTARGGCPPPKVELVIERGRDLTASTALHQQTFAILPDDNVTASMPPHVHAGGVGPAGRRGFRLLTIASVRSTRSFLPSADDNDRRLLCIVTVPGLAPRVEALTLNVDYSPKITCVTSEALVDDANVCLKCDIRSKPKPLTIFWILSPNGSTLQSGEVSDNYWAVTRERRDDVTEALMYMRRATPDKFRRYTIVAENNVGIGRRDVELVQVKRVHPPSRPLSDAASAAASSSSISHTADRVASRDTAGQQSKKPPNSWSETSTVGKNMAPSRTRSAAISGGHRVTERTKSSTIVLLCIVVLSIMPLRSSL